MKSDYIEKFILKVRLSCFRKLCQWVFLSTQKLLIKISNYVFLINFEC